MVLILKEARNTRLALVKHLLDWIILHISLNLHGWNFHGIYQILVSIYKPSLISYLILQPVYSNPLNQLNLLIKQCSLLDHICFVLALKLCVLYLQIIQPVLQYFPWLAKFDCLQFRKENIRWKLSIMLNLRVTALICSNQYVLWDHILWYSFTLKTHFLMRYILDLFLIWVSLLHRVFMV